MVQSEFSHPRGYSNPVIFRISAALPAAGAWDATPIESPSSFVQRLTLYFTYTQGEQAGGGAFDWQLEASGYAITALAPAGASEWTTEPIIAPGTVVAGAETQNFVQTDYQTFTAVGSSAEDFHFGPIEFDGTVERIRVRARESGFAAVPGTLQITGVLL